MDESSELEKIDSSVAYRLARYVVIPRLKAEVFPDKGAEPFRLRDDIYAILNDEVKKGAISQADLNAISRTDSQGRNISLKSHIRFFVILNLKETGAIMTSDRRGYYILSDSAVQEVEEIEEEDDEGVKLSIYAYTFPSLKGKMIKVGVTSGEVQKRIYQQLGTANPEPPEILKTWEEIDAEAYERAIHSILKARGKLVNAPRATEWFHTTVDEVESIIQFIKSK